MGCTLPPQSVKLVDPDPELDPEPVKLKHDIRAKWVSEVRFKPGYITTNGAYVQTSHKYD